MNNLKWHFIVLRICFAQGNHTLTYATFLLLLTTLRVYYSLVVRILTISFQEHSHLSGSLPLQNYGMVARNHIYLVHGLQFLHSIYIFFPLGEGYFASLAPGATGLFLRASKDSCQKLQNRHNVLIWYLLHVGCLTMPIPKENGTTFFKQTWPTKRKRTLTISFLFRISYVSEAGQ